MRNRRNIKRYRYSSKGISLKELHIRDNGICARCGNAVSLRIATRDHRKAKSKGGSNKRSNLQLMCYSCNQIKADS